MKMAWDEISARSEIGISIDLFRMGILFFDTKNHRKENFRLYYF
jgi:hypothetical protein